MAHISISPTYIERENPADNVTFFVCLLDENGKASVRHPENETVKHTHTLTSIRQVCTYCHVHNFKFDTTTLQVICFVYIFSLFFSSDSLLFIPILLCTASICLFRLCLAIAPITYVPLPFAPVCMCKCCLCDSTKRHRHYTILCIHIFCKTNENILMSSLNIT